MVAEPHRRSMGVAPLGSGSARSVVIQACLAGSAAPKRRGPGSLAASALSLLALIHERLRETVWKVGWRGVNEARSLACNAKIRSPCPSMLASVAPVWCPSGLSRQSLEEEFSEVRSQKAEKASGHTSEVPRVALALELVVIIVVRRPPGNGSPISSQHITPARWVGRIEHQALIRRPCAFIFLEVLEVELTPRQRDAI